MSDIDLTSLRADFAPEIIGKLPRVTCGKCSKKQCSDHRTIRCDVCKSWVSEKHIHVDYVGHADVTDRLLSVDPEWDWQPKATDPDPELLKAAIGSGSADVVQSVIDNAPPKFERNRQGNLVGLWIKLTVGGKTRLGYGSCPADQHDPEKVLIGDALRNAAMRFGVALTLWAKGDRADPTMENAVASGGQSERHARAPESAGAAFSDAAPQVSRPAQQRQKGGQNIETDPEAEKLAERARNARTLTELTAVRRDADKTRKAGAFVRNPVTQNVGKLAVVLEWRRKQLTEIEEASADLAEASKAAGISAGLAEEEFTALTGKPLAAANPAELRRAAQVIREKAAAQKQQEEAA
jgi:hypothetical protein